MADLSVFPVTGRWRPTHPDRIQLYSFPTPNGVKVSAALEELALPYEAHRIDILADETWTQDYLALNPNGKIPAIIDPDGPSDAPIVLFESGAILLYLAEKTGKLLPTDPARRHETIQWLFFQNSFVGPIFGQFGWFHRFAGCEIEDRRPHDRFLGETRRLLGVLDQRLKGREWIMDGDFTIADLSLFGWVRALLEIYDAKAAVSFDDLNALPAWLERVLARPAIQRGLAIPS
ncbi:MAG: glutathione S-transferase N-terminal domain-containing protein [Sphingobium sp.]